MQAEQTEHLPGDEKYWGYWEKYLGIGGNDPAEVFGRIYRRGQWSGPPGQSPSGAKQDETIHYVRLINGLIALGGFQSVVDLGCGDGTVTRQIIAPRVTGVDCVPVWGEAILLDLDRDRDKIPSGDILLLKDVLQHLPNALIINWLSYARRSGKWRWLILTNDTHQKRDDMDCRLGGYRAIHPHMRPLRDVPGLQLIAQVSHKAVCLLRCDQ